MLHLRGHGWVQAEHTLTHTLIWGGLWDTKGTLTVTMNFCTWEAGAEELQVTGLKQVLVKRQTKQNTPQQSLSPWTASYDGPPRVVPTAVPQKIPESGTAHFAALQYQQIWPSEPPQTVLPELWHKRLHRAEGIPTWRSAGKPPAADGVTFTAVVRATQNWTLLHSGSQTEYLVHPLSSSRPLKLLQKFMLQWLYAGSDQPDHFFP